MIGGYILYLRELAGFGALVLLGYFAYKRYSQSEKGQPQTEETQLVIAGETAAPGNVGVGCETTRRRAYATKITANECEMNQSYNDVNQTDKGRKESWNIRSPCAVNGGNKAVSAVGYSSDSDADEGERLLAPDTPPTGPESPKSVFARFMSRIYPGDISRQQ